MKFLTAQLMKENNLIFIFRILLNNFLFFNSDIINIRLIFFYSLLSRKNFIKILLTLYECISLQRTLGYFELHYKVFMHPAGFEPAMSRREADYESDAFGHLATDALCNLLSMLLHFNLN